MRKLLLLLLALPLLAACGGEDVPTPKTSKGAIRPFALVRIEADKGVKLRATADEAGLLSALEIVKRGQIIHGVAYDRRRTISPTGERIWVEEYRENAERGFGEHQRDTISEVPALTMFSTDILSEEGELRPNFIHGYDWIILDNRRDTIAYVPNAILRQAEKEINAAYADSNFNRIYELFNTAFKFRPITGKMYRELQAKGEN